MKKIVALLAIVSILLSLTSCSVPVNERTLVAKYEQEYTMWADLQASKFNDWKAFPIWIINFMGKTYYGTYSHSCLPPQQNFDNYQTNVYTIADSENTFGINASTNELVYIVVPDIPDEIHRDDNYDVTAESVAATYIDPDQWNVAVTDNDTRYTYTRYIEDVATCEELLVYLNNDGSVRLFNTHMLGAFDAVMADPDTDNIITRLQSEEAMQLVDAKIKEKYATLTTYDITRKHLVLLENNQLAISYQIRFPGKSAIYDGMEIVEEIVVSLQ